MQERTARQEKHGAHATTPLTSSLAVLALALSATAARADIRYGVSVGAGRSDNITRVPENEIDENMASAGFTLNWKEKKSRLDADVTADLSYVEYLQNTYDSEVVGNLDGKVNFEIADHFSWEIQDNFGQARADPFSPVTPDNRENVNYFTTGPNFIVNVGSQGSLTFLGRYSTTNYEKSPMDATRATAGIVFGRELSKRSELGMNLVSEKVEFQQNLGGDYRRDAAYLSYNLDASRTDIVFDFGYTWLRPDDGVDDGAPYIDLAITRNVTPSSTLELSASTQFSDTGDALSGALDSGDAGSSITASADPFESHQAGLEWIFTRHRTTFGLAFSWMENEYENQTTYDSSRYTYTANFTRDMTPQLDLELRADYTDETFDNTTEESQELSYGATLSWRLSRMLSLRFDLAHYTRDSTSALGEYDENRVFLYLAFEPRGSVGLGEGP